MVDKTTMFVKIPSVNVKTQIPCAEHQGSIVPKLRGQTTDSHVVTMSHVVRCILLFSLLEDLDIFRLMFHP